MFIFLLLSLAKIDVLGERLYSYSVCAPDLWVHKEFEKQKHNSKKSEAFLIPYTEVREGSGSQAVICNWLLWSPGTIEPELKVIGRSGHLDRACGNIKSIATAVKTLTGEKEQKLVCIECICKKKS